MRFSSRFPEALSRAAHILRLTAALLALSGCQSIHSRAVVDLIEIEHEKVAEAKENAKKFDVQTKQRVDALEQAVSNLDDSVQVLKQEEAKHALIFSSNQNLSTKSGVDAYAVAYLVARIYASDQVGLNQQVKDQFKQDFAALNRLSKHLNTSWDSIEKLQAEVLAFSKKSGLASVDPEFVRAVIAETDIDTSELDDIIKRSNQVNTALKESLSRVGGAQKAAPATQTLDDLIELLENMR